tara:strand:- start:16983 stop:17381 length:399 start_codon:yes stop_codon:yes gene_type:complete
MQQDYADTEVRGLERFFPTALSRTLLVVLITAPVATFWVVVENAEQLLAGQSGAFQILAAVCAALSIFILILIALVVDLALVANHAKHQKIRHMSNIHPSMSFKWLYQNGSAKHYIFVIAVFSLGVICGKCL